MEIRPCKDSEPEKVSLPDITGVSGPDMPELKENSGKTAKIMIVEDDDIIQRLLEIQLNILGYNRLYMAKQGEQAVKLNQEVKADIIFMDINMPGKVDGIDAAREIKKISPDSQIIFLTGQDDADTLSRAKAINPAGYILKPFTASDLRITLTLIQ
jgi:YesN/AraC family two-component response regulator